ncbi:hypothetical protein B484DRAFT_400559 [Ochromonadaceae sp. CCMP2298]|nr:hypothetical protein B484DRAFT_400559 [Ochromonadaceae sp. CCMP2298]
MMALALLLLVALLGKSSANVFPYTTGELFDTNNAMQNTVPVSQDACTGDKLIFSTCDHTGDPYIRLYLDAAACGTLVLQLGCYLDGNCSMTATVAITQPPTPQPTALPTTGTSAPTAVNVFPYTTGTLTDTNNALQNTVPVQQSACAGESFVFSTCSYDSGDTLIRLYLGGVQLAQAFENTYNSNTNNYCSVITYTYTDASCGTLVLQLGCSGSTTCSMTATVAITTPTPSAPPTAQPSNPTPAPSTTRPTTANTFPFTTSRSNTNNALQNTAPVQQTACAGDVLLFSTCSQDGGYDIGRTYLRLYNGAQVASANDNAINPSNQPCSQILYTHTGSCTTLVLQLGCSATTSCTMKATRYSHTPI